MWKVGRDVTRVRFNQGRFQPCDHRAASSLGLKRLWDYFHFHEDCFSIVSASPKASNPYVRTPSGHGQVLYLSCTVPVANRYWGYIFKRNTVLC